MLTELFLYDEKEPLLFTSGTFLCLFVAFLFGYALFVETAARGRLPRILYLYGCSLFFYYKTSGLFVGLLVLTTVLDYSLAWAIHRSRVPAVRRLCLAVSLLTSLGILGYLKYGNFLIDGAEVVTGASLARLDVILPVGISFYTFQSVSYVVDVYRRALAPVRSLVDYGLYLSFFPQIVAGPIVRASEMLPQLARPQSPTERDVREGLGRALVGLFKKAAIADYLAVYVDAVFTDFQMQSGVEIALGVYAYTLQIYFDFSGYSDLAIGIALMLGFRLPENFDAPYRAESIAEFWHRWHMTLSSWLRDYVYVPLGGNRQGRARRDRNLMATMLVGGLWHGAAWQFVLWGGLHGFALLVHKRVRATGLRLPRMASWLLTFHFVAFAWTLFRAPSLEAWWGVVTRLWAMELTRLPTILGARWEVALMTLLGLGACLAPRGLGTSLVERFARAPGWARVAAATVVVQAVLEMRSAELAPFIYFQF